MGHYYTFSKGDKDFKHIHKYLHPTYRGDYVEYAHIPYPHLLMLDIETEPFKGKQLTMHVEQLDLGKEVFDQNDCDYLSELYWSEIPEQCHFNTKFVGFGSILFYHIHGMKYILCFDLMITKKWYISNKRMDEGLCN
eukprot:199077_1